MKTQLSQNESLMQYVADEISWILESSDGNVRIRFDGLTEGEAYSLIPLLSSVYSDLNRIGTVAVLSDITPEEGGISVDTAIELRNLEGSSLALLVPLGRASGESSLKNTFKSYSYKYVIEKVADRILNELEAEDVEQKITLLIKELLTTNKHKKDQDWVEFLLAIKAQPSEAGIGLNLWRLGLIPDVGPEISKRLKRNIDTCRRLKAPPGPSSTTNTRLSSLGLRDSKLAWELQNCLSGENISQVTKWTRKLLDKGNGTLTFERWELLDDSSAAIQDLRVNSFTDPSGNVKKYNRLAKVEGSEIIACVLKSESSGDMNGKVGVEWSTIPVKDVGVHEWLVEVIQPIYVRNLEPEISIIGSAIVKGATRKALVLVALAEDDYVSGSRYIFRITGRDKSGQTIQFTQDPADISPPVECAVESDEFQLGIQEAGVEVPSGREASTVSFALAQLEEARHGAQDFKVLGTSAVVDEHNGIAEVTSTSGRKYSIRFNTNLGRLQKRIISEPGSNHFFTGSGEESVRIAAENLEAIAIPDIPQTFLSNRRKFFKLLESTSPKDWPSVELSNWNEEVIEAARAYGTSYKRALDASSGSTRSGLTKLDTLLLDFTTNDGLQLSINVTLPTHPLRALWWAQYVENLNLASQETFDIGAKHRANISSKFMLDSAPTNYPFAQVLQDGQIAIYIGELTLGTGVFISPSNMNSAQLLHSVQKHFGVSASQNAQKTSSKAIVSRLNDFAKLHSGRESLSIKFVNDLNGNLANDVMRSFLAPKLEDPAGTHDLVSQRVEIYTPENSFGKPAANLSQLQREYSELNFRGKPNFLVPPLSLAMQPISKLRISTNYSDISIVTNYEKSNFIKENLNSSSIPLLDGLQTRIEVLENSTPQSVLLAPSIGGLKSQKSAILPQAHQSFLRAVANPEIFEETVPLLMVSIPDEQIELLEKLHAKSEWVVSLEQHAGVHLFEQVLKSANMRDVFILDYTVDGVDSMQDRITVTSTDRAAVETSIAGAMTDLNLSAAGYSSKDILRTLSHISGRLALRLRENNNRAKEIVGLAAVVLHLGIGKKLENTILIPVDEHPEIFHPSRRGIKRSGRRCDLMLVRLSKPGKLQIELVEVKFRSSSEAGSQILFEDICDQLITTRQFIKSDVLSTKGQRPDENWQWARFSNLLHFYLEKGYFNGNISSEAVVELKSLIDKAYERKEEPIYSASGYVVATNAADDLEDRSNNGAQVKFLAANLLNHIGRTTTSFGPEITKTSEIL
jgi:DNA phosphorothioation-dependent restriction protein DptH